MGIDGISIGRIHFSYRRGRYVASVQILVQVLLYNGRKLGEGDAR